MLLKTSQWLKKPMLAVFILVLLYIGSYAALYHVSDYATVSKRANAFFSGSHRSIQFDSNIDRRLFPRPTIILKNVVISEYDSTQPAFRAQNVSIGVAWSSLFGQPEIEKLVLNHLEGQLSRADNGVWSSQDLWHWLSAKQSNNPKISINRLQVNQGKITLHFFEQQWVLDQMNFATQDTQQGFAYILNTVVQSPNWTALSINASGEAKSEGEELILPEINLQFQGKENNYDFSGSLAGLAAWQDGQFFAEKMRFNLKSFRYSSNLDTSIDKIHSQYGVVSFSGINSLYKFLYANQEYTGNLTAGKAKWSEQRLSSDSLHLALSTQTAQNGKFNLTLNGSGSWQENEGIMLPEIKVTTMHNTANNQAQFVSEWEAALNVQNAKQWQIQANGLFDRQPAQWQLKREQDQISGDLSISKLDLVDYFDSENSQNWQYPDWGASPLNVRLNLNLGTLKLPSLEINDLQTTVAANAKETLFKPLTGELYSGRSHGELLFKNTTPLSIALIQNSENIQVQPLLQDLLGISRFSGVGQADFAVSSQGSNHQEMLQNLSGSLKLNVHDGHWLGINFAQLFKTAFGGEIANSDSNAQPSTPFSTFQLNSTIKQGISEHQLTAKLITPNAHLSSKGQTDLGQATLREDVVIEGENRPPLPIRISGKLDTPSVTLNYQQIISGSKTTQDKQKAISNTLIQQWQWLKKESQ